MAYEQEAQIAIAAATAAAQLCERVRRDRRPDAIQKQDHSPVTVADFGAQAVICRAIAAAFPCEPIVAEEDAALLRQPEMQAVLAQVTEQVQILMPDATPTAVADWIDHGNGQISDRYWTLDPIDGTKGFLRGDQYAIALALIEAGEVKVGVLACPALPPHLSQPASHQGTLFVALRGQGTRLISLATHAAQSIHVTSSDDTAHLRLIESIEAAHGNLNQQRTIAEATGLIATPIQMDSQAKYGVVARGEASLYLRLPRSQTPNYQENIWDHAAGAIVVEEAGGKVTDMYGKPLDFTAGTKLSNNRGIVASNGAIHATVLAAIEQRMT
jgi:3'(2'), 5'-bisphosphate nucleotidase